MIRRLMPLLLAGMVIVVSLAEAQDPADSGDPPVHALKKKKRSGQPPAVQPKDDKDKEPVKPKDKGPGPKAKMEEDPLENEDGPGGEPEQDEKEVLERIGKNMRAVEEKLGNRELGDPTSQQQRDILKDLDSLINKKQQSQGGGGGGGADQQPQGGEDKQDKQGEKGQQQPRAGQGGSGEKRGMSRSQQRKMQRQQRQKRGQRAGRQGSGQPKSQAGQPQPQQQPGAEGNTGGAGKKGRENEKNLNADLDKKDVWGHLPESMRATMNAYSNPSPFLPRYDDLIKKYYRTIAEQGRKKGD